jgi:S-adenosylmethionine hydrolase
MAVVTITTDLGTADFYLAALKGALYKQCGEITVVDVNVQIRHFDIKQAVYHLQQAYSYFPETTIHIVHINPNYATKKLLITYFDNQFFIAFDNGFLPLFLRENRAEIFAVNDDINNEIGVNGFMSIAKVVQHLIAKKTIGSIASSTTNFMKMSLPNAAAGNGGIKGSIISIDAFGNVITNIHKTLFETHFKAKQFTIRTNHITINEVKANYGLANDEGELIALFNDSGLLEIAIVRGKAASLLGLSVGQNVFVISE